MLFTLHLLNCTQNVVFEMRKHKGMVSPIENLAFGFAVGFCCLSFIVSSFFWGVLLGESNELIEGDFAIAISIHGFESLFQHIV